MEPSCSNTCLKIPEFVKKFYPDVDPMSIDADLLQDMLANIDFGAMIMTLNKSIQIKFK